MMKLKERWKSGPLSSLRDEILDTIKKRGKLENCQGLIHVDGKIDLRGFEFPHPENIADYSSYRGMQSPLRIAGYTFDKVDFTKSDLSFSIWKDCFIRNCLFDHTDLSYIKMADCQISDSTFLKSNLRKSSLVASAKGAGSLAKVSFIESNLAGVDFVRLKMEKGIFKDCKFQGTQFNGGDFIDCAFLGRIENAWFRGFPWSPTKPSFLEKVFLTKNAPVSYNRMVNVDFSESLFGEVFFTRAIDLSTCIFPVQHNYLKVANMGSVFKRAKEIIDTKWDNPYKEHALKYIENFYYNEEKQKMEIDFIYTDFPFLNVPADFNSKFFGLIKEMNDKTR